MEYRRAGEADLEILWNRNIAERPNDPRWLKWKVEYIGYNRQGRAVTFCAAEGGIPVGEATLLLSPDCEAVAGEPALCRVPDTANLNALRILKAYEGQGHMSALVKALEAFASARGITRLTIGVEARETRNLAIYLHWGFTEFLFCRTEDGEPVLYFGKTLPEKRG